MKRVSGLRTAQVEEVVVLETAEGLELAADVELLGGLEEVVDTGVQRVLAAKDLARLEGPVSTVSTIATLPCKRGFRLGGFHALVGPVDVVDGQDGEVAVVAQVTEGDAGAGLGAQLVDGGLVDVEGYGHAEEDAVVEAVVLDDAVRCQPPLRFIARFQGGFGLPIVVLLVHEA